MNKQQERFVDAYVHCLNGTKAALLAGYAEKSARQTAHRLLNDDDVKQAVADALTDLHMSWEEAARRVAITAATDLRDFLVVETVIESHMTRKPLQALIEALELEYKIEEEFFEESGMGAVLAGRRGRKKQDDGEDDFNGEDPALKKQNEYFAMQQERRATILRYRIELRHNPYAYRDVPEARPVKRISPDLVAIKESEEAGAIKKLSFDKRGLPIIEMYPADHAQEIVLKMKGKLVEKHDHTSDGKGFFDFLRKSSTATPAKS